MDYIKENFYNFKYGILSFLHFIKVIWRFRDWDYSYSHDILLVCLKRHLYNMEHFSNEINEDRKPKEIKLKRAIELLQNKINDDYGERCDVDVLLDDDEFRKKMVESYELEKKEWKEFTTILNDEMDGWWN